MIDLKLNIPVKNYTLSATLTWKCVTYSPLNQQTEISHFSLLVQQRVTSVLQQEYEKFQNSTKRQKGSKSRMH